MKNRWTVIGTTSGAKIYWLLISFVMTVVTARYLGPSGRGTVAAATTWVTTFSTFGYLSLSQVVLYIATTNEESEWLPNVFGTLLVILGAIALLGWTLAIAGYFLTRGAMFHHLDPAILMLAFAALPFMLWAESGNSILIALGQLKVINIAQVVGATLCLGVVVVLVAVLKLGPNGAVAGTVLYQIAITGIGLQQIVKRTKGARFDLTAARQLLTSGAKLHITVIGTFLALQANILILNNYRTTAETGLYQLALQLMMAVQVVPTAVSMVMYSMITKDGPDDSWEQQRKLVVETLVLMVLMAVSGYVLAPWMIPFVAGKAFAAAVPIFRILMLCPVGMSLSVVMGCQWITRGLFGAVSGISIAVGVLTVAGNYFFVPRYGMIGAAWVTVAVYGVSIVINGGMALWVERRFRRIRSSRLAFSS